jgi:hypothetical protein
VPELTKAGYFELMFLNRGRFLCVRHMAPNVPRDPSGNRLKSQIDLKHLYNKGYSVMQKKLTLLLHFSAPDGCTENFQ